MSNNFKQEAEIFGKYLLNGKIPDAKSISLYVDAMNMKPVSAIGKDEKILKFILRNPRFIGMIDGALAFSKRKSIVRRKILFMSAILETRPEYAQLFLQKERSWFYNIYIFWVGFRAILKAIGGKIILAFF